MVRAALCAGSVFRSGTGNCRTSRLLPPVGWMAGELPDLLGQGVIVLDVLSGRRSTGQPEIVVKADTGRFLQAGSRFHAASASP